MMGYYGLWGMGLGMILMVVFWVAVVALAVWLVSSLFPRAAGHNALASNAPAGNVPLQTNVESPIEILKRRYASGEISKTEFEDMRRDLQALER